MISTYRNRSKSITWLDLENPSMDEVRGLVDKYTIDPVVANELLTPSPKPHIEYHNDYIYLILHFPTTDKAGDTLIDGNIQEVDFVIGKNFIITTRYNSIDAVLQFSKMFEVSAVLDRGETKEHPGRIFFYMIKHLYKSLIDQLEFVKDLMKDIENNIFKGREAEMVVEISKLNRRLLNFKSALSFHKDILVTFEKIGEKFFGGAFDHNLKNIINEYMKVESVLEDTRQYLLELRNTNDSLLTTKQNETMKNFTVMAFLVLPLSLVASIFGMNIDDMPIVGSENGFLMILGLMIILVVVLFIFFRSRKWL